MISKISKASISIIIAIVIVCCLCLLSCKKSEVSTTIKTEQEEAAAALPESEAEAETTQQEEKEEVLTESETSEASETQEETAETIKNGEVTFKAEDGIELNGNIFGQGNKWVVLSHMYPTDQTSWFDFAKELAGRGYVALTFDFRGYGKSKGNKDDIPNIDKDIKAAIAYVKQYDYEKLFLIGASMGGTATIVAAAEEDVSGVVTLAAPDKMGNDMDALAVVSKLKMPKIFISAKGDEYHAESANRLYENAVEPKAIEIIEGKAHGTFIFEEEPENAQTLKDIIFNFLDNN